MLIAKIRYYVARRKVDAVKIKDAEEGKPVNRRVLALSKLINHKDSKEYLENFVIPASYVILKNRDVKVNTKSKEK